MQPYSTTRYGRIKRLIVRNLEYCGQIAALMTWYDKVRAEFMNKDVFQQAALAGLKRNAQLIYEERCHRLADVTHRIGVSLDEYRGLKTISEHERTAMVEQENWIARWDDVEEGLKSLPVAGRNGPCSAEFLAQLGNGSGAYLDAIHQASPEARAQGREWLQSIVDSYCMLWDTPLSRNEES